LSQNAYAFDFIFGRPRIGCERVAVALWLAPALIHLLIRARNGTRL
jgi:hypothetical protein